MPTFLHSKIPQSLLLAHSDCFKRMADNPSHMFNALRLGCPHVSVHPNYLDTTLYMILVFRLSAFYQ